MGEGNILVASPANSDPDQLAGRKQAFRRPKRRLFFDVMEAARQWWPNKTAAQLANILGCDVRSAERYLAGHRTPDADAIMALLVSDYGDRLVAIALAKMPWDRQLKFSKEMAKAARRIELVGQLNAIEKELRG